MPLTDAEKVSIRRHLGYNAAAEANYPWIDTFHSLTNVLDSAPEETATEARDILGRLSSLEEALDSAPSRLKARKVGEIQLNGTETDQLWREVRRWRRELATLLGVPLAARGTAIVVV